MVKVTKNYVIHFVSPYDPERKFDFQVKHEKKDSLPEIIELINALPENDNQIYVKPEFFANKHSRKNTALLKPAIVQNSPTSTIEEKSENISIYDQVILSEFNFEQTESFDKIDFEQPESFDKIDFEQSESFDKIDFEQSELFEEFDF